MATPSPKVWFVLLTFVATLVSGAATAEDFRIETRIFIGEEVKPVSENSTLFLGGIVYDFLKEPAQTAVFRKPLAGKPGRFILMDRTHKIKTELETDKLSGAMDKLRTWASRQRDPFLKFAADPKFDESFDTETNQLVLASHVENYRVETVPSENDVALAEYREFLDWYTKLNTLLHAGPPPEPRLRLNDALARYQVIPVTIQLTRVGEETPMRAEHDFVWRLSREDREQIDAARNALASYRDVTNEEFLRTTQRARSND